MTVLTSPTDIKEKEKGLLMKNSITPSLRKRIKDAGLTLSLINTRYWRAKKRSLLRAINPPNRKSFYLQFIKKFEEQKLQYPDLTPVELFHMLDVHSTASNRGYSSFDLIPKDQHIAIHKQQRMEKWNRIVKENQKHCSMCGKLLSLDNFSKDASKPDGKRPECKNCSKERALIYKELKGVA